MALKPGAVCVQLGVYFNIQNFLPFLQSREITLKGIMARHIMVHDQLGGCTISQHLSLQDICTSACMVLELSQFTDCPVYISYESTDISIFCLSSIVIDSAVSSK